MCAEVRNGDPSVFTPEIHVPPGAPAIDRLAGFLGRDPGWSGGQQPVFIAFRCCPTCCQRSGQALTPGFGS